MKKWLCFFFCLLLPLCALAQSADEWDKQCTLYISAPAEVYTLHTDWEEGIEAVDTLPAGARVKRNGMMDEWMYIDYFSAGQVKTGVVRSELVASLLPESTPMPTAVPQYARPAAHEDEGVQDSWVERYGSYTSLVYQDGVAEEVLTSSLIQDNGIDPDKQFAMVKASTATRITLRAKASTKANAVTTCPVGTIVPVLSLSDSWAKIAYGDFEGFVSTNNLQFGVVMDEILGYGTLTMEDPTSIYSIINIRAKASASATKVAEWFPGNEVVVLRHVSGWYEVEAFGIRGYVMEQYVSLDGE